MVAGRSPLVLRSICYKLWCVIFAAGGYKACWLVGYWTSLLMVGWLDEWQAGGLDG